jgi:hypothetical protein
VRRVAVLALLAALLAGCGGNGSSSGRATVWITRDRGAQVLHVARVPAGLTAIQGLERVAKVETRYGGRYVRAVDGVEEHGRKAWFYYVNGYLADRGAAEYRLRAGEIEWWDYRSWRDPAQDPVVVGAFPEPFLHGYGGQRRKGVVVVASDVSLARRLARLVGGRLLRKGQPPAGANVLELVTSARPRFAGRLRSQSAGGPVEFVLDAGFARRLLADPDLSRHRYSVP